jgi:hypothetical protein
MKLALPAPPRRVRLGQVPGAPLRVAIVVLGCALVLAGALALGARQLRGYAQARAEDARAVNVEGVVASVERGERPTASALFELDGRRYSGSGIVLSPEHADRLRAGAVVKLRVDPLRPEHPLDPEVAEARTRRAMMLAITAAICALLVLLAAGWAIVEIGRRERRPLREGLLIWLTPNEPIEGVRSVRGHYFRQDVRYEVRARVRPKEPPIRNGEKVLAAVAPPRRHAIVVDEQLAKTLGWLGD